MYIPYRSEKGIAGNINIKKAKPPLNRQLTIFRRATSSMRNITNENMRPNPTETPRPLNGTGTAISARNVRIRPVVPRMINA
jgi:hypothetical protein